MAVLTALRRLGGASYTVEAARKLDTRPCVFTDPDDFVSFPEFGPVLHTTPVYHMTMMDAVLDGNLTALRVPQCVVEEFNYGKPPEYLADTEIIPSALIENDSYDLTIIGATWTCNNYFHWLHQGLASMYSLVNQFGEHGYQLALPRLTRWQEESLEAIGLADAPRVLIEYGRQYQFRRVAFSSILSGRSYMYNGIAAFANAIKLRAPVRKSGLPTRVYISRGDSNHRKIENDGAIIDFLRPHGFEPVNLGSYSFLDQVALMSGAEYVVGPHGAGFANTVFCQPGTRVLEFMARQYTSPCMCVVAQSVGLEYHVHFSDAPGATQLGPWHADVDGVIARLKRIL